MLNPFKIVSELFRNGADVNMQNAQGDKALIIAAKNNAHTTKSADVARVLISGGAKVDLKDIYGNTALMYAAVRGEAAVVSLLIESKADFNAQNQKIMNLC